MRIDPLQLRFDAVRGEHQRVLSEGCAERAENEEDEHRREDKADGRRHVEDGRRHVADIRIEAYPPGVRQKGCESLHGP